MKKELRVQVYNKYGGRCAYCGKEIAYKDMQVDHLTPKILAHWYISERAKQSMKVVGDSIDSFENLMPSCRRCNHYKRAYRLDEFRRLMKTLHKRIQKDYISKVAIDYGIVRLIPFDGIFYFEKCKL